MPKYAIMRHTKHKAGGNLNASLQHNFRERETLNADEKKTPDNEHLIQSSTSTKKVLEKLYDRLPAKVRKNGVVAVEYLITASPEFFKDATQEKEKDFFKKSLEYLVEKYSSENIISATIHRDETTPHMAAFVVPITRDGRLCARDFLGGRKILTEEQTAYAKKVEHLGLERGIEKSTAQHKTIKEYYRELNEKNKDFQMPKIQAHDLEPQKTKIGFLKTEKETAEQVALRINRQIKPVFEDLEKKANSRRFEREKQKSQAMVLLNTENRRKKAENSLRYYENDFSKEEIKEIREDLRIRRVEKYHSRIDKYATLTAKEQRRGFAMLSAEEKKAFLAIAKRDKPNVDVSAAAKLNKSKKIDIDIDR